MMTTKSPILVLVTALLFAFVGACGPSKADLQKAQKELKDVTAERDELRAKLVEKTLAPIEALQRENAELREKLAAVSAEKAAAPKAAGSSSSKKKTAAKAKKKKKKKAKK